MCTKQNIPFDPADNKLIVKFTTYMVKVVTHAKIDYMRRQKHLHMEILSNKLPEPDAKPFHTERWQDMASEGEFYFPDERTSNAYSCLPYFRRRILELSFIENLTSMEIAELLGCSVKLVYNAKHTALRKLRDILLKGDGRDV